MGQPFRCFRATITFPPGAMPDRLQSSSLWPRLCGPGTTHSLPGDPWQFTGVRLCPWVWALWPWSEQSQRTPWSCSCRCLSCSCLPQESQALSSLTHSPSQENKAHRDTFSPINPQEVYTWHLHTSLSSRSPPPLWGRAHVHRGCTLSRLSSLPTLTQPRLPATSLAFMMHSPTPTLRLSRHSCPSGLLGLPLYPCCADLPSVGLHPQPTLPHSALALTHAWLQRPSGRAVPQST